MNVTMIRPISSQTRADVRVLEHVAELHGASTSAMLLVVEVGDELRDQQEQEEQAREARPRLRDRLDHVVARP